MIAIVIYTFVLKILLVINTHIIHVSTIYSRINIES